MTDSLNRSLSTSLINLLFQLESADDQQISGDFAVALMEMIGSELQKLEEADLTKFISGVQEMTNAEKPGARRDYLEVFADNFGLVT
jgi:hypothetical protein